MYLFSFVLLLSIKDFNDLSLNIIYIYLKYLYYNNIWNQAPIYKWYVIIKVYHTITKRRLYIIKCNRCNDKRFSSINKMECNESEINLIFFISRDSMNAN